MGEHPFIISTKKTKQKSDPVVYLDIDPDTLSKIIETHNDVKHILTDLQEGRQTFKEHGERIRSLEQKIPSCYEVHDERLRTLEKCQSSLGGKIAIIVIFLGSGITLVTNFLVSLWAKTQP